MRHADHSVENIEIRTCRVMDTNVVKHEQRPCVTEDVVCPGCDNDGVVLFDPPDRKQLDGQVRGYGSQPSTMLVALMREQPQGYRTGMPCPRCQLGALESSRITGGGSLYGGVDLEHVTWDGGRHLGTRRTERGTLTNRKRYGVHQ